MKRVILFLVGASLGLGISCSSDSPNTHQLDPSSGTLSPGAQSLAYQELHRPQFHFSPPAKWMNDPNGMVFYQGKYHLFYQYYPDSTVWGPMHWGHTVSQDLVNWENLPIALYPDELGYIFSGSAVLDGQNTSGLGSPEEPPLVAIFTYHDPLGEKQGSKTFQTQGLAFSLDQGQTWEVYDKNPVLPNPGIRDFRDPKVFWHEESAQWVMVLATADRVSLFASPDLKSWEKLSEFGEAFGSHVGVWECPDLFPLKAPNGDEKWVMLVSVGSGAPAGGSGTQYFYGNFDGKSFTIDPTCQNALGTEEAYVPPGDVFADFEGEDFGDWTVEGEAFGPKPAPGAWENQYNVMNYQGKGIANSFKGGDAPVGRMVSPTFTIEKPFINFQIGGGAHPQSAYMKLIVDGKTVRSSTGDNSETLTWSSWELSNLQGKTARIEIVDSVKEGWGHILLDQIIFAEEAARPRREKALWLDYGADNYAGVTWANIPEQDGRRLFIAWMSNWAYATVVPTETWRSAMTLPRTLRLGAVEGGLRLKSQAVTELEALQGESIPIADQTLDGQLDWSGLLPTNPALWRLSLDLELEENGGKEFSLSLLTSDPAQSLVLGYLGTENEFFIDRRNSGKVSFSGAFPKVHKAPRLGKDKTLHLDIWLDASSLEVFADGGLTTMTDIYFSEKPFSKLIWTSVGPIKMKNIRLFPLRSIWQKPS